MFTKRQLISMAAAMSLICFMAFPALGQQDYQQGQQGQQGYPQGEIGSQPQIDEETLEKTAEAYTEITTIHENFQSSLQQTEDPAERQEMQAVANEKMVQAINEAGLEVEEYTSNMQAIRTDQRMGEKFMSKVQSMQ